MAELPDTTFGKRPIRIGNQMMTMADVNYHAQSIIADPRSQHFEVSLASIIVSIIHDAVTAVEEAERSK